MTVDPPDEEPRKERLQRLDRIFVRSPIYFVTMCTINRRSTLVNSTIHEAFLDFANAGEAHGAYVGAYVIMPDHVHLFVALEQDRRLGDWTKSLKNTLSKSLRMLGIHSPHWQKGFFDHVLRSGESYSQKWEYVRDNPVRAGLVKRWEEWIYRGEIWAIEYRK